MVADLLTKCLATERFQMLRGMMVGDGAMKRGTAQRSYAVMLAKNVLWPGKGTVAEDVSRMAHQDVAPRV